MTSYGSFSGNPKTEWLIDPKGNDRDMKLLKDFSFTDPNGKTWMAPKGAIINGASIPRPLWSIVGSPYTDAYRRASIVHDVACESPHISRKEADVMFYYACRAAGCSARQSSILYIGVRLGAWASSNLSEASISAETLLFRDPNTKPSFEESHLKTKLLDISSEIKSLPAEPSIEQLDIAISKHISLTL